VVAVPGKYFMTFLNIIVLRNSTDVTDAFDAAVNDPEMIMMNFVSWKYLCLSIRTNPGFVSLFPLLDTGREVFRKPFADSEREVEG
jgi:hypothetical protein